MLATHAQETCTRKKTLYKIDRHMHVSCRPTRRLAQVSGTSLCKSSCTRNMHVSVPSKIMESIIRDYIVSVLEASKKLNSYCE